LRGFPIIPFDPLDPRYNPLDDPPGDPSRQSARNLIEFISQPWPWYIAGPLIGLVVPALLILGGKQFGVSSNLRHLCAAMLPTRVQFFQYDWRKEGLWNLVFIAGAFVGGFVGMNLLASPSEYIAISAETSEALRALGVNDQRGFVPAEFISWEGLLTVPGVVMLLVGGFLVGFGSRYAGGCTSGHAISGLSNLQFPSLVAVIGFFVGGLIATFVILPLIL
jgi:hypothetical protein